MSASVSAARLRQFIAMYLALIAGVTLLFALLNARAAHPWVMGEWLINYSAGLIRRGLAGECVLLAHRLTGLPLLGLASALQLSIYTLFYLSLLPLLRGLRWSLPLLALLLSPATLAFTVLDPPTSVRKEALLFLALSLLANAVVFRPPSPLLIAGILTIIAPALVLTHEALLGFLPWLAVPLLLSETRMQRSMLLLLAPALSSLAAFALVFWHPGTPAQVQTICSSVHGSFFPNPGGLCTGAIAYLELTPALAHADDFRAIRFYGYGWRYALPVVLTFLPVAALLRNRLRRGLVRSAGVLLSAGAVSAVGSLPLFFFARDWGRWFGIHATCLLLLFLLLERRDSPPAETSERPDERERETGLLLPQSPGVRAASLLALLVYATCWTLPAVGNFPGRFGYIDLWRYLRSYHSHPHLSPVARTAAPAAVFAIRAMR